MARSSEVLQMLCKGVEYVATGENYEDIDWCGNPAPITKKQYQDGFAKYDAWKAEQETSKANAKEELLSRLGITAEEAQLLLS